MKLWGQEIVLGNRGQPVVLSIPPGGYTVWYLKLTLGSAKGYLRPLQKDLVLKFDGTSEECQTQVGLGYIYFTVNN